MVSQHFDLSEGVYVCMCLFIYLFIFCNKKGVYLKVWSVDYYDPKENSS